jgi:dTDP-glucose 4,6-dehydratase/UDP-glucose 4-epimerase
MKILIIGSGGFIGSHLRKYFIKSHDVYTCDLLNNPGDPKYTQLERTCSDFSLLFRNTRYDVCINCSGAANVSNSFVNTVYDFELNSLNVIRILESIRQYNNACKFINMSSAAVYGNPETLPIKENDEKLMPVSPYGFHKLISEIILDEYHTLYNIKTCTVRLFSAYGNGLKKQLIYDISRKILKEKEIHLYGTGLETRDFIHIFDICSAINSIIENDKFESSRINVANGKQIKISSIVEIFRQVWNFNKKIVFDNIEKTGDPKNWEADITILKSYGYKQKLSLYEGIKMYKEWIEGETIE